MQIYVILSSDESLTESVVNTFPAADRILVSPGIWFVRSELVTSSDVVGKLGIKVSGKSGIVIAAKHYDGVADRGVVEKLAVWERAQ